LARIQEYNIGEKKTERLFSLEFEMGTINTGLFIKNQRILFIDNLSMKILSLNGRRCKLM
jgi:hypothetical protein